jgi:hypothetical protein
METEMDTIPFKNKKASDYTLNDSLKQAAAAAVVTTVVTAVATVAVMQAQSKLNEFWKNRKAKKEAESTEK